MTLIFMPELWWVAMAPSVHSAPVPLSFPTSAPGEDVPRVIWFCRVWRWPPLALKAFVFGTNFPSISNDCLLSKLICWGADFNNLYFRANVASLFMGDRNVAERVNVVQWEGHRLWDPSGHQDHQRTTCATWLWTWPAAYDLSSLRLSKMMRLAAITPTSQR